MNVPNNAPNGIGPTSSARLMRLVLILGIVALVIFIFQQVWSFGQTVASVLSTLAASWFLATVVRPLVSLLQNLPLVPRPITQRVRTKYGDSLARRVSAARMPFSLAVAILYVLVLFLLIGGVTLIIAAIVPQATTLIRAVPDFANRVPELISENWGYVAKRFNLDPSLLNQIVSAQEITTRITNFAQLALNQTVNIVTFTAGAVGQIGLVIILSLYIVIEDKLIERQFFAILPRRWNEGIRALLAAIDRSFSGYLRGNVIAALIRSVITFAIFTLFGVNFGIVVGFVFGILSFIPLIGSPIGIVVAAVVTLIFDSADVWSIVIMLSVLDFIIAYFVLPQLLSDAVGVPSLIGLIAISIGVNVVGFWGLVFSIPVVGAAYAVVFDFYLPRRRRAEGLPEYDPAFAALIYPRRVPRNGKSTVQVLQEFGGKCWRWGVTTINTISKKIVAQRQR